MKPIRIAQTAALTLLGATLLSAPVYAGPKSFNHGKAIPEYGKIAVVDSDQPVYRSSKFKIVFDVSKQADYGKVNRNINSVARFINMHVEAGVRPRNIKLAVVLHGKAAKDVTQAGYYAASQKTNDTATKDNANAGLVQALIEHGVEFYVCGQTAAYYDIKNEDLLPGVKMALSAMTSHALLQQKGYTLNPF